MSVKRYCSSASVSNNISLWRENVALSQAFARCKFPLACLEFRREYHLNRYYSEVNSFRSDADILLDYEEDNFKKQSQISKDLHECTAESAFIALEDRHNRYLYRALVRAAKTLKANLELNYDTAEVIRELAIDASELVTVMAHEVNERNIRWCKYVPAVIRRERLVKLIYELAQSAELLAVKLKRINSAYLNEYLDHLNFPTYVSNILGEKYSNAISDIRIDKDEASKENLIYDISNDTEIREDGIE